MYHQDQIIKQTKRSLQTFIKILEKIIWNYSQFYYIIPLTSQFKSIGPLLSLYDAKKGNSLSTLSATYRPLKKSSLHLYSKTLEKTNFRLTKKMHIDASINY
jgi:hypothetical protein